MFTWRNPSGKVLQSLPMQMDNIAPSAVKHKPGLFLAFWRFYMIYEDHQYFPETHYNSLTEDSLLVSPAMLL